MILQCLCYTYIHPAASDPAQPCAVVCTVKTVSHTSAAAPTGFMSGFMEQLKALLQQLRVFDPREFDLPQIWNTVPE